MDVHAPAPRAGVSVSVLVPCLDEAENLPALIQAVGRAVLDGETALGRAELVLIDDGSADGTEAMLATIRDERILSVRHPRPRGIPAAWASGLAAARGEYVCVLDADLQYDPAEIARLCEWLARGDADLVQGARAPRSRERDLRYLLSRGLNRLLNGLFGMSLADNKSGFFACRKTVLEDLLRDRHHFRHFQCLIMVAARQRGYRLAEVETPFRARRAGRSAFGRIPVRATVEVLLDLARARRHYRAGS